MNKICFYAIVIVCLIVPANQVLTSYDLVETRSNSTDEDICWLTQLPSEIKHIIIDFYIFSLVNEREFKHLAQKLATLRLIDKSLYLFLDEDFHIFTPCFVCYIVKDVNNGSLCDPISLYQLYFWLLPPGMAGVPASFIDQASIEGKELIANRFITQEELKELIYQGANLTIDDENGNTALIMAVQFNENIIGLLLRAGADINGVNRSGQTALMAAIIENKPKIIPMLIGYRAQVNQQDNKGKSALMHAIRKNHIACVHELLGASQININQANADAVGITPLIESVRHEDNILIKKLINYGVDVNKQDKLGRTPLMLAMRNNQQAADILMREKVDPNLKDKDGKTALMHALDNTVRLNEDLVTELMEQGARLDIQDGTGKTVLIYALEHPHIKNTDIVHRLLNKGVSVNERMYYSGQTALILAIKSCQIEYIQLLLDSKADCTMSDNTGRSAYDYIDESKGRFHQLLTQAINMHKMSSLAQ